MTVMVWFYEHRDVLSPLMDLGRRVVEDEESEEEETDSEEEEEDQDDLGEVRQTRAQNGPGLYQDLSVFDILLYKIKKGI